MRKYYFFATLVLISSTITACAFAQKSFDPGFNNDLPLVTTTTNASCIIDEFSADSWPNISSCTTNGNASIGTGNCLNAKIDDTNNGDEFDVININAGGKLIFANDNEIAISASTINIGGDNAGGSFIAGTLNCQVKSENRITVTFTGERPVAAGLVSTTHENMLKKGIIVKQGGVLYMHGSKGAVLTDQDDEDLLVNGTQSWTYLSKPAGPRHFSAANGVARPVPDSDDSDRVLHLGQLVEWEAGDWIIVTGTTYAPDQTEFVQIESIETEACIDGGAVTGLSQCSKVTLSEDTKLAHYHFGMDAPTLDKFGANETTCNGFPLPMRFNQDAPASQVSVNGVLKSFCDSAEKNYGVDEAAEVGLISRNITLTASPDQTTGHYGGQIRIESDFGHVEIVGAELVRFGQDIRFEEIGNSESTFHSAYPIHFHETGARTTGHPPLISSNSIHHTFNKCITIHGASNIHVKYNVCARIAGHGIYLENGRETENVIKGNLVAGAMATQFSPMTPSEFWKGDFLAASLAYDGQNILTTTRDDQLENKAPTPFWISNPANEFTFNAASGCQLQGRGYWILPASLNFSDGRMPQFSKFHGAGFKHNRAHACYTGIDSGSEGTRNVGAFSPTISDKPGSKPVYALIESPIVTRNRLRGIWLRPSWFVVNNARSAMNRAGISLVTGGGVEGIIPGVWGLVSNSVFVGISTNNVERFGECPETGQPTCYGEDTNLDGEGIPNTTRNFAGYMFYDGPARLEKNRFVNFNVDISKYLTNTDRTFLENNPPANQKYEGDAAIGWFPSNVNNYPPTQYTEENIWENTDFRHQVFTENVRLSDFVDGDKNTVILDRDGTLSGLAVVDAGGQILNGVYPISLNNLAFNGSPWTVNECFSTGAQDALKENRPTSLMSPHSYATLEATFFNPRADVTKGKATWPVTIWKDQVDYKDSNGNGFHASMTLIGRNRTQVREPKIISGLGYTFSSEEATPGFTSFSLTDADGAWTQNNPFNVRLGLCYNTESGPDLSSIDPDDLFDIRKGRVSFGGENGLKMDATSYKRITECDDMTWQHEADRPNDPDTGKKSNKPIDISKNCPANSTKLQPAASIEDLADPVKNPGFDKLYFWDSKKGMLFFYVDQQESNAAGLTPAGSCQDAEGNPTNNLGCKNAHGFYPCPKDGCELVTVRVIHSSYNPVFESANPTENYGKTTCSPYDDSDGTDYTQKYPSQFNQQILALLKADGTPGTLLTSDNITEIRDNQIGSANFPHNTAEEPVTCVANSFANTWNN